MLGWHNRWKCKGTTCIAVLTLSILGTLSDPTSDNDNGGYRSPLYKRGVPQTFDDLDEMGLFTGLGWWFNYGMEPNPDAMAYGSLLDMEYVPLVWGDWIARGKTTDADAYSYLSDRVPFSSKAIMVFNEPNHRLQSNVTPERAADLWPLVEKVAKARALRIGGPAANPCNVAASEVDCMYASPFRWWDAFFSNCTAKYGSSGCRVDFMTSHIYTCSVRDLAAYVRAMKRYKRPIWLTELACPAGPQYNTSLSAVRRFLQEATLLLDKNDAVEKYAWFAPRTENYDWLGLEPSLLEPYVHPAQLSPLGTLYLTAQDSENVQVSVELAVNDESGWYDWDSMCSSCWEEGPYDGGLPEHCAGCGFFSQNSPGWKPS